MRHSRLDSEKIKKLRGIRYLADPRSIRMYHHRDNNISTRRRNSIVVSNSSVASRKRGVIRFYLARCATLIYMDRVSERDSLQVCLGYRDRVLHRAYAVKRTKRNQTNDTNVHARQNARQTSTQKRRRWISIGEQIVTRVIADPVARTIDNVESITSRDNELSICRLKWQVSRCHFFLQLYQL